MTKTNFNESFKTLLKAFHAHEDLRQRGASIPELSRSNYDLHVARMNTYHASR